MARVSCNAMKKLGGQWTMVHGHFTNMGGFVLKLPGRDLFPLWGDALEILASKHVIDVPDVTEDEIEDHSKADGFAQLFGVFPGVLDISPVHRTTFCQAGRHAARVPHRPNNRYQLLHLHCSLAEAKGRQCANCNTMPRMYHPVHQALHLTLYILFTVVSVSTTLLYSGSRFLVRGELLNPQMRLVWNISCAVSVGAPFVSIILILLQKFFPNGTWIMIGTLC